MSNTNDQLNKVTTLLEDISIKPDKPSREECIIKNSTIPELSPIDSKTLELLELLSLYEEIANDEFRFNFINGFLNLSRANYSSGSVGKKFGIDSYDLREYPACKEISYRNETFEIKDILKNHIEEVKKKKEKKSKKENNISDIVNNKDSGDKSHNYENRATTSATESNKGGALRNRKINIKEQSDVQEDQIKIYKDPLAQFGVLAPYQLKQSQSYFIKGLNNSIEIINLQRKITTLISEIDDIKNECNGI